MFVLSHFIFENYVNLSYQHKLDLVWSTLKVLRWILVYNFVIIISVFMNLKVKISFKILVFVMAHDIFVNLF